MKLSERRKTQSRYLLRRRYKFDNTKERKNKTEQDQSVLCRGLVGVGSARALLLITNLVL